MERLLVDRKGLEMELEDMATHEEVDSLGSEVGNHQSQMAVVQRSLQQILAEPSLLLGGWFMFLWQSFLPGGWALFGGSC